MSDIKTTFTDLVSGAHYVITERGIKEDKSLATAVIISLFTDKRDPSALPNEARGWWADDIGSLRWTLLREKQTDNVLNRLIQYDTDALKWSLASGVVITLSITTEWTTRGVLKEFITLRLPDGQTAEYLIEEV